MVWLFSFFPLCSLLDQKLIITLINSQNVLTLAPLLWYNPIWRTRVSMHLLVFYNVNCKILLTQLFCRSIAVNMDDKPVRIKREHLDNEGEVEILKVQEF